MLDFEEYNIFIEYHNEPIILFHPSGTTTIAYRRLWTWSWHRSTEWIPSVGSYGVYLNYSLGAISILDSKYYVDLPLISFK